VKGSKRPVKAWSAHSLAPRHFQGQSETNAETEGVPQQREIERPRQGPSMIYKALFIFAM